MLGTSGNGWIALGAPTARLAEARLQAHHALQVVAAAGHSRVPVRADDSHAATRWSASLGALLGEPVPGSLTRRVGLRVRDLSLLALGDDGDVLEEYGLARRTLSEAFAWTSSRFCGGEGKEGAADRSEPGLVRPGYDLPAHPVEQGRAFDVSDAVSLAELAAWYANAARALEEVARAHDGSSPVRCWPHHFDIATLITLEAATNGGPARTVGAGMTPGDGSYGEPYLYVTPWPYPGGDPPESEPPLGAWHTSGWFGAVLTGSRLTAARGGEAQRDAAREFFTGAIPLCSALALG